MKPVICSNPKCAKIVGELESGTARFKCKSCGTYTTASINKVQPEPQQQRPSGFKRN